MKANKPEATKESHANQTKSGLNVKLEVNGKSICGWCNMQILSSDEILDMGKLGKEHKSCNENYWEHQEKRIKIKKHLQGEI